MCPVSILQLLKLWAWTGRAHSHASKVACEDVCQFTAHLICRQWFPQYAERVQTNHAPSRPLEPVFTHTHTHTHTKGLTERHEVLSQRGTLSARGTVFLLTYSVAFLKFSPRQTPKGNGTTNWLHSMPYRISFAYSGKLMKVLERVRAKVA
jgi:hypothetical protein